MERGLYSRAGSRRKYPPKIIGFNGIYGKYDLATVPTFQQKRQFFAGAWHYRRTAFDQAPLPGEHVVDIHLDASKNNWNKAFVIYYHIPFCGFPLL